MRIVKKIKAVLKVQRRRLLVKIGATTPAEKTSTDGFTSRWSEYRSHRRELKATCQEHQKRKLP